MQVARWKAEAATYAVLLAAFSYFYWLTFFFGESVVRGYPGAAFFPRLIQYFTIAATVVGLVLSVRSGLTEDHDAPTKQLDFGLGAFALTILTIAVFILLLPVAGFEITCFGMLLVLLAVRLDGWVTIVLTSLVTTAIFYVLFVLMLQVSLPLRFLPAYLNF